MTPDELVSLVSSLARRLATIADQVTETREQSQHTLDRINCLRRDLKVLEQHLTSSVDTIHYVPGPKDTGR